MPIPDFVFDGFGGSIFCMFMQNVEQVFEYPFLALAFRGKIGRNILKIPGFLKGFIVYGVKEYTQVQKKTQDIWG